MGDLKPSYPATGGYILQMDKLVPGYCESCKRGWQPDDEIEFAQWLSAQLLQHNPELEYERVVHRGRWLLYGERIDVPAVCAEIVMPLLERYEMSGRWLKYYRMLRGQNGMYKMMASVASCR